MNLDPLQVLRSASAGMFDGSMLGPREGYEQASSLVFGLALGIVADQLENAASNLVEENVAIRGLFADAVALEPLELGASAAELERLAVDSDAALQVSALRASNDALREALSQLLDRVEQSEGDAVRALEDRIWEELDRSTQRRAVGIAPF